MYDTTSLQPTITIPEPMFKRVCSLFEKYNSWPVPKHSMAQCEKGHVQHECGNQVCNIIYKRYFNQHLKSYNVKFKY